MSLKKKIAARDVYMADLESIRTELSTLTKDSDALVIRTLHCRFSKTSDTLTTLHSEIIDLLDDTDDDLIASAISKDLETDQKLSLIEATFASLTPSTPASSHSSSTCLLYTSDAADD